ncbi:carboxymuconolactone decarboxylase family protein [Paenibacillus pinihumi]|uniref:carboxymuconolactone decarboxylase family protein n=1 Tax=Paenibacillus pinihumi TaxID=669462 RepID=UPI0003F6331E|nr:carboxymuconolactone decarboxylase family protein [Paenibacillus pinihumi]
MELRLNYMKVRPESLQTLLKLEGYAKNSGLDHKLWELIKIRASQINGCAYCLDMHTKDARATGETEQRLYMLSAWREAPFYTEEERAALALTEAVTQISNAGVPQELYEQVRKHFDEGQFVDLIMAINAINSWNRIAISTGMVPGDYQPAVRK